MVTRVPPVAISIEVRAWELPAPTRVSAARCRVPTGSVARPPSGPRPPSAAAPLPAHPAAPAQTEATSPATATAPAHLCCRCAIAAYPQPVTSVTGALSSG